MAKRTNRIRFKRKKNKRERKILNRIFDIFAIAFPIWFAYLVYIAFSPFISKFISSAPLLFYGVISVTLFVIIVWYLIYTILRYFHNEHHTQMPNLWVFVTLTLMTLFFATGAMVLNHYYGEPQLSLVLRNSDNIYEIKGNITCKDNLGLLTAGNEIYCEVNPKLTNISANVSFQINNGSIIIQNFSDLRFFAPEDVYNILFNIRGIDIHNETLNLQVGYRIKFYTETERRELGEKYATYFLFLLAAVLFSVPVMMNNFKSLSKPNTH
jgi:hypothetical protein